LIKFFLLKGLCRKWQSNGRISKIWIEQNIQYMEI